MQGKEVGCKARKKETKQERTSKKRRQNNREGRKKGNKARKKGTTQERMIKQERLKQSPKEGSKTRVMEAKQEKKRLSKR